MKARVELDVDIEFITSKDLRLLYERHYKDHGALYDDECDTIYYVVDVPYLPLEGQTLNTKFGICTVIYSLFDIDGANLDNALEYSILVVKAL